MYSFRPLFLQQMEGANAELEDLFDGDAEEQVFGPEDDSDEEVEQKKTDSTTKSS
jgi:hypothetical protein